RRAATSCSSTPTRWCHRTSSVPRSTRCAAVRPEADRRRSSSPRRRDGATGLAARLMQMAQWAPGCFIFAERTAFERAGGFDERYFASEEIHLSRALKRLGPFVLLREPVVTSARKAEH